MFGKSSHSTRIGIHITPDTIAVSEFNPTDPASSIKSCFVISSNDEAERTQQLESYIKQNKMKKRPCTVVLDASYYDLYQLPAPPVADDELKSAMRWRVKDLIAYPIEDAVIDVFRVPVESHREAKVYVVVSPTENIQNTVKLVEHAGLSLEVIDIAQLGMLSVIEKLEAQKKGLAVLYMGQQGGSINLYHNNNLFLSRKIDIGLERIEALHNENTNTDNLLSQVYDPIILELQRSLDFYESEFAKPPITRLMVVPRHPMLQSFCDYANSNVGMDVGFFNLAQLYTASIDLTDEHQASCLVAVAAASRRPEQAA